MAKICKPEELEIEYSNIQCQWCKRQHDRFFFMIDYCSIDCWNEAHGHDKSEYREEEPDEIDNGDEC